MRINNSLIFDAAFEDAPLTHPLEVFYYQELNPALKAVLPCNESQLVEK